MVKLFSNPHHLIFWEGHVWAHRRNVCTQSTPELKLKLKTYQSIYQKMHVRAHARDQSVLCLIDHLIWTHLSHFGFWILPNFDLWSQKNVDLLYSKQLKLKVLDILMSAD